ALDRRPGACEVAPVALVSPAGARVEPAAECRRRLDAPAPAADDDFRSVDARRDCLGRPHWETAPRAGGVGCGERERSRGGRNYGWRGVPPDHLIVTGVPT